MGKWMRMAACLMIILLALPALAAAEGRTSGIPAEAAERPYAERLAEARLKYNEESIHFYRSGIGARQKGKINVCMYLSKDQSYYNVKIYDSTQITDEAEIEAILEAVMRDRNFHSDVFGSISNMKAQWIAHNIVYSMATGTEKVRKMIETLMGEDITSIVGRSRDLDINPPARMTPQERLLYDMIEMIYQTDKQ